MIQTPAPERPAGLAGGLPPQLGLYLALAAGVLLLVLVGRQWLRGAR